MGSAKTADHQPTDPPTTFHLTHQLTDHLPTNAPTGCH